MGRAYYSSVDGTKTAHGVNYHGTNCIFYFVRNTTSLVCQQRLSFWERFWLFPFQVHFKTWHRHCLSVYRQTLPMGRNMYVLGRQQLCVGVGSTVEKFEWSPWRSLVSLFCCNWEFLNSEWLCSKFHECFCAVCKRRTDARYTSQLFLCTYILQGNRFKRIH